MSASSGNRGGSKLRSRFARALFFGVVASSVVGAFFGTSAEAKPPRAAPVKPAQPKAPPSRPTRDAGVRARTEDGGAGTIAPEARYEAEGGATEVRTGDGGKSFRFEALEVEGRLKSPQIVYFLRRVRAEFAAGDLGHRSFSHEMSETRNEPSF